MLDVLNDCSFSRKQFQLPCTKLISKVYVYAFIFLFVSC